MSYTAVQEYVRGILDGIATATIPPSQAWSLPPTFVQAADNPQIFVWGGPFTEDRATLPRGRGQKRTEYRLSITVLWFGPAGPDAAAAFPVLVDAIRAVLRSVPLSVAITDPVTAEATVLTDIGEAISGQIASPVAAEPQSTVLQFSASFTLLFHEWLGGA